MNLSAQDHQTFFTCEGMYIVYAHKYLGNGFNFQQVYSHISCLYYKKKATQVILKNTRKIG